MGFDIFSLMYKLFLLLLVSLTSLTKSQPGEVIDSYQNVPIFFNGKIGDVHGRHKTPDGYNLGLKWQCVEYVKRFYYVKYKHKMPDAYGHAKDLFDESLADVAYNEKRGLLQFRNVRYSWPQQGDLLVLRGNRDNPYGHCGIISRVDDDELELMQQNYGNKTRVNYKIVVYNNIVTIAEHDVLGWLRMP